MKMRDVSVLFSDEEIEHLTDLAAAEGGTLGEYVRLRVFGPVVQSHPVSALATREGERIRNEASVALYDRIVDALIVVRKLSGRNGS
jgi:hypothetical protein